jgi:hypothetical protein
MEHKSNAPALQGQTFTDQGVGAEPNFDHNPRNFDHRGGRDSNSVIKIQSPGSAAHAASGERTEHDGQRKTTSVPTKNKPANKNKRKSNRGRPRKWDRTIWGPTLDAVRTIRQRCLNRNDKDYSQYRERLCQRWADSFETMAVELANEAGLKESKNDGWEYERRDNTRPYEPGNVTMVGRAENNANRNFDQDRTYRKIGGELYEVLSTALQRHHDHTLPYPSSKALNQLKRVARRVEGYANPEEFMQWIVANWLGGENIANRIKRDAGTNPGRIPRVNAIEGHLDLIFGYYLNADTSAAQSAQKAAKASASSTLLPAYRDPLEPRTIKVKRPKRQPVQPQHWGVRWRRKDFNGAFPVELPDCDRLLQEVIFANWGYKLVDTSVYLTSMGRTHRSLNASWPDTERLKYRSGQVPASDKPASGELDPDHLENML